MKKVSLVNHGQTDNTVFSLDERYNRDNCLASFRALRTSLNDVGFEIATNDIIPIESADVSIFCDFNSSYPEPCSKLNILMLFESELIQPEGWKKNNLDKFDKVFTWNDELVDDKKFIKFNFSHEFPNDIETKFACEDDWNKKALCTLISGNKIINHKKELYTKRKELIQFLSESCSSDDFTYYGLGWDTYVTNNRYVNYVLRKLVNYGLKRNDARYGGPVKSKFETLSSYKFSICFENGYGINGYITEKIFDCFFSGNIPIYYGADNIEKYIPKECFIDYRDFKSDKALLEYMRNFSKQDYMKFKSAVITFLTTSASDTFNCYRVSENIAKVIRDEVK